MTIKRQTKILLWIAGWIIVFSRGGFSYRKYIEMRIAGVESGDALLFMIMIFFGFLLIAGALAGFIFYYVVPESITSVFIPA